MNALNNFSEAADGLLQGNIFALIAGELLGHMEGLAQEPLHLTGAVDGELVFLAQLSIPMMAMMS